MGLLRSKSSLSSTATALSSLSSSSSSSRSSPSLSLLVYLAQALNASALAVIEPETSTQGVQVLEQVILQAKTSYTATSRGPCPICVAPLYKQEQDNGRPTTFLHPFVVHVQQESLPQEATRAFLSIAFFNMALGYHVQAEQQQDQSYQQRQYALSQAHATYLYALELLDVPELIDPDGSLIYVYLALCLNLEHIEAALGVNRCSSTTTTDGEHVLSQPQSWKEALENAFWTLTPDPECPVYRHFERTTSSTECPF